MCSVESTASLKEGKRVTKSVSDHKLSLTNLNQEESFYAHVNFDLAHKPWELLNALKIFKVAMNSHIHGNRLYYELCNPCFP